MEYHPGRQVIQHRTRAEQKERSKGQTMGKLVEYEFDNGLAVVTVNNPPVNSLTVEMCDELKDTFRLLSELEVDDPGFEKKRVQISGFQLQVLPAQVVQLKINRWDLFYAFEH